MPFTYVMDEQRNEEMRPLHAVEFLDPICAEYSNGSSDDDRKPILSQLPCPVPLHLQAVSKEEETSGSQLRDSASLLLVLPRSRVKIRSKIIGKTSTPHLNSDLPQKTTEDILHSNVDMPVSNASPLLSSTAECHSPSTAAEICPDSKRTVYGGWVNKNNTMNMAFSVVSPDDKVLFTFLKTQEGHKGLLNSHTGTVS